MRKIQGYNEKKQGIHYEYDPLETPLGIGGMGTVYRGWRFDDYYGSQREVAIKELKPGLPANVVARAKREASLHINSDNLIEMLGFVEVPGFDETGTRTTRFYVISEYLRGVTLEEFLGGKIIDHLGNQIQALKDLYDQYIDNPIDPGKPRDPYNFALLIVKGVLMGLSAMHYAGCIHRDIDPSNIMITSEGKIKLIDFGIAKKIGGENDESNYTQPGQFIGKPKYAAPELAQGLVGSLDVQTDLYSVGILLYRLVTGHVPFNGSMAEILRKQQTEKVPLKEIRQEELRKVIRKATEKEMGKRYQSASEFLTDVEKLSGLRYPARIPSLKTISKAAAIAVAACGIFFGLHALGRSYIKEPQDEIQPVLNEIDEYSSAVHSLYDAVTAADGLEKLNILASEDGSYDAMFLLSRLYFSYPADSIEVADSVKRMQAALGGKIAPDNIKAHELLLKAVQINDNDYRSLYELGCDYMSKDKRGAEKDLAKSQEYLRKAYSLAEAAGDEAYLRKIQKRLEAFE